MATSIGKLSLQIGVDASGATAGLDRMQTDLARFGQGGKFDVGVGVDTALAEKQLGKLDRLIPESKIKVLPEPDLGKAEKSLKGLSNIDLFKGLKGGKLDLKLFGPEELAGARAGEKEAQKAGKAIDEALHPKKMSDRVKDMAGKVDTAFGAVKTGADILRGKAETTGQALKGLGSIASTIPGPWGAAAGAILSVAGEVVDYMQGPLLKSQAAARQGFLDVATGVKTISQAMRDVKSNTLAEGLEKLVKIQQRGEQFAGGAFESVGGFFQTAAGSAVSNAADASPDTIVQRMQQREQMMRNLLDNPRFRELRGEMATQGAMGGLEEMARAPRLQLAQRTINRSLRGEQGFNQAQVEASLMAIARDRFDAQNLQPTIEQERLLQEQAQATATALRAQYAVLANDQAVAALRTDIAITNLDADAQQRRTLRLAGVTQAQLEYVQALQAVRGAGQLGQQIQQENEQMGRQIATFGQTTREAAIYNRELDRRDVLTRLASANTDRLSVAERRALQANLDRINAGIAAQRANDQMMTRLEAQQQLRQETTGANASRNHLFEQMEHPGEFIADMSREEAQLAQLRLRGAEAWRIQLQEANIEALRGVRTQQLIAQAGFQTFQQTRTPLEQYEAQIERLETMRRSGVINEDTHARAVDSAANRLMGALGTEHGAGSAMAEGSAAAQAAIARNNRRVTGADRAAQIRNAVEQLRRIQEEHLREVREMARALRNAPPVRPMNL